MTVRMQRGALGTLAIASLAVAACGGEGGASGEAMGETAGAMSLGEPEAIFAEDFGAIQTVRELPDGRLLVADPLGGALYTVDLDAGTRTAIGSEGQGPGEYRQPDAVWPLPGDSSLVVDLGNGRLMTLGPDLEFGETAPLSVGDPRSGMIVALPQAVDDAGNVYARSMGGGMGALPDSGAVLRIERETFEIDTVASFKLEDRTVTRTGGPDNENVAISQVPLSAEDAWGVASDGSVVVARSSDYHVEWLAPDGAVTSGNPIPFDPVSIGQAEKEEWSRARSQSGGGIGIQVMMNGDGQIQTSFQRGGLDDDDDDLSGYDWPATKPPFYPGRIPVDGSDRAWIRRHMDAGDPTTYDVFDRARAHVGTWTLPSNKRILSFGAGSIYVVAFDEFDLNFLERYAMPM